MGIPANVVSPGRERASAGDSGVLELVGNVEIDAAVLMFAVLGLQGGNKLAQSLAFFSHHVRKKQAVEQAITLGQVALKADAA